MKSPNSIMLEVVAMYRDRPSVDRKPLQVVETIRREVRKDLIALNYNDALSNKQADLITAIAERNRLASLYAVAEATDSLPVEPTKEG